MLRALANLGYGDYLTLLMRGALALMVWEVYTRFITEPVFGVPLRPEQLAKNLFRTDSDTVGRGLHFLTAIVLYPLLWTVLQSALQRYLPQALAAAPLRALVLGFITWVLALGVLTPLAGGGFMAGWTPLTWSSLLGHLLYSVPITA